MSRPKILAGALAAVVAVGILLWARGGLAPAQQDVTCTDAMPDRKHADSLATKLLRREARGALTVGGAARLVPLKGAGDLSQGKFAEREQAVALLDLRRQQGSLGPGVYCMRTQLVNENAPSQPSSWKVAFYFRNADGSFQTQPAYTLNGLLHYWPETEDASKKVRPSARIAWYDPTPEVAPASPTSTTPAAVAAPSLQVEDGEYAAWYRCGSGCCGASLNFS